ncbi:putative nucleus protein [Kockovaella imperatae]|uniref:Structural maintenance of chromosomes protein 5 n=1 Tax=Kockovaella imperatae TaxID=4999 RepID=A0A1Y1UQA8_9TREE|nr:putative nucleus protein [Kockovaella imperatae]ORX40221.1 putative nucleus protein [Kockovaella imperatae]
MSSDLEEGPSQAVRRPTVKRSAKLALSESEDEGISPKVNGHVKRARPSTEHQRRESDSSDSSERRSKPVINGHNRAQNGSRRLSPDENGEDDNPEDEVMDEDAESEDDGPHLGFRPEYDRDAQGFVAGSITRIMMRNFMTYDFVEFKPGPHLNMILGPNGSGKSSIAACIAVGLGFPPGIIGRASDLKAFVKQGAEEAETEIELKGRTGEPNVQIRRKFNREDNKSDWLMNGRASTHKAVTDVVTSFGVQANNLCSFLPQDKVAEFAKMAPVTVLKETMRAAGDPRLTKWHETLKDKGATLQSIEDVQDRDVAKRDELQKQVDRMEPDVRNLRERADQQQRLEVLRLLEVASEHKSAADRFEEVAKERKSVLKQQTELNRRRVPLLELQEKQANLKEKAHAAEVRTNDELKDYSRKCAAQKQAVDNHKSPSNYETDLKALNEKLKEVARRKEELRRKIRKAQDKLDEPRVDSAEKITQLIAEKRKIAAKFQEAREELHAVEDRQEAFQREIKTLSNEIDQLDARQKELGSIERQRETIARDFDGSINYALDWIEKNAMKLEATVHKPPMISVNVTDKAVAWQVEACTTVAQRRCFICESRNDYNTLLELNNTDYPARRSSNGTLIPAGKVRLTLQYVEVNDELVNPTRPCDVQKLQELGFTGWALDYVECAPAVRAYLVLASRMHQAAITRLPGGRINANAVAAAGIRTWVTSTDVNRALQSLYGRKDFQITTTPPIAPKAFSHAVDAEALKKNQRELAQKKQERQDREGPLHQLKQEIGKARVKSDSLTADQLRLEGEIKSLRDVSSSYQKAEADKKLCERELRDLEAEPSAEEQRRKVKTAKLQGVKKVWRTVATATDAHEEALQACLQRGKALWSLAQYELNCNDIEKQVTEGNEQVAELNATLDDLTKKKDTHRATASALLSRFNQMLGAAPRDVYTKVRADIAVPADIPAVSAIQDEIAEIENRLELTLTVDPTLIERYERLSNELANIKDTVERQEQESRILKRQINRILTDFDPALDTLVDVVSRKFSAAFERVGCSGEVKLNRVEGDFSAWGIHIMVSYRDGDNLQQLTGTLQSGGERSLATVTYLMSLSEMARTPFSLVDEINQGMDQKAERNVHNQLVEVTCNSDTGQYFLITPKLLTGLKYQRKMKILIVNNGTWLADSTTNLDKRFGHLKQCLQKYKRVHVAAH